MTRYNNFSLDEFECKCGCGSKEMDSNFMLRLDAARTIAATPFNINSGFRCKKHNESEAVGGSPTSSHIRGLAADIECNDSTERAKMIPALWAAGIKRIGIGKDFLHVDLDPDKPSPVIWHYY